MCKIKLAIISFDWHFQMKYTKYWVKDYIGQQKNFGKGVEAPNIF